LRVLRPFARCVWDKPLDARDKQESPAASKLDLLDFKGLAFSPDDQVSATE
jgi:hypothetical protein